MSGTIKEFSDHGSIVAVVIEDAAGDAETTYFDHRMFWEMFRGEDGRLVGRDVEVSGDPWEQILVFND